MNYPKNILRSQSGQGVIEYILLLTVVVTMILGALYQFNQAFQVFADNYFGNYLSCLIESGELPNLNGTGGVDGVICNQAFKPFSLTDGKALVDAGGNSNPSGASTGGSGSGVTTGGGGGSSNGNLTMIPNHGGSSGSFGSGSSRFAAPNLRNKGQADAGKSGALGGDAITDLASYSNQDRTVRIPLRRSQGILGSQYRQEEEKDKDKTKITDVTGGVLKSQRSELIRVQRKVASAEKPPEIEEFTLGNLLRYLIMAAIILAIVIFIGGQIMQVSKSMD